MPDSPKLRIKKKIIPSEAKHQAAVMNEVNNSTLLRGLKTLRAFQTP